MKPRSTLTPVMLRTRYHERSTAMPSATGPRSLPPLAAETDADASADWLAQLRRAACPGDR